jgi:hypothetical protein
MMRANLSFPDLPYSPHSLLYELHHSSYRQKGRTHLLLKIVQRRFSQMWVWGLIRLRDRSSILVSVRGLERKSSQNQVEDKQGGGGWRLGRIFRLRPPRFTAKLISNSNLGERPHARAETRDKKRTHKEVGPYQRYHPRSCWKRCESHL